MKYCIVKSGIIANIIECEDAIFAQKIGAVQFYENAKIGDIYNPSDKDKAMLEKIKELTISLDKIDARATYTAIMTNTFLDGG